MNFKLSILENQIKNSNYEERQIKQFFPCLFFPFALKACHITYWIWWWYFLPWRLCNSTIDNLACECRFRLWQMFTSAPHQVTNRYLHLGKIYCTQHEFFYNRLNPITTNFKYRCLVFIKDQNILLVSLWLKLHKWLLFSNADKNAHQQNSSLLLWLN